MLPTARLTRLFCLVSATLVVSACESVDTEVPRPFEGAPWTLAGPHVHIGDLDDPDFAFGAVTGLAAAPDGTVLSRHSGEASLRRWSSTGEPAGFVGRKGEGPGEFLFPTSMGFFGDSLWVMDGRQLRISFFDLDGSFLGAATPRVDLGSGDNPNESPPRPTRPLRDGSIFGNSPAWSQAIADGSLTSAPFVHMDREGTTLDTVWVQHYKSSDQVALLRAGGGGTYMSPPFADQPLQAVVGSDETLIVLDRRVFTGEGVSSIRTTKIDIVTGDTLFSRSVEYAPRRLLEAEADRAIDEITQPMFDFMSRMDPGLTLGSLRRDLGAATHVPDFVPAVRSIIVGDEGGVFLRRFDPPDEGDEWWVLDVDGHPLGRLLTPPGLRVLYITGDDVWGVETDEFDVNYIVKYTMHRPSD